MKPDLNEDGKQYSRKNDFWKAIKTDSNKLKFEKRTKIIKINW